MFNLLTGGMGKGAGTVHFQVKDISAMAQRDIARLGMARTFQHVKLRPP